MNLDASVLIFQSVSTHLADFVCFESNRYTNINRTGDHSIFCLDDSIAQSQLTKFICKLKSKTGTITGCTDMFIVEFHKVIFESCFGKTFKCHTCRIDTKSRCASMCRNSLCINANLAVRFCHFVFLKFGFCKSCFQFVLQSGFCRNDCIAGITHSIGNKTSVHGNDPGILRMCCHHYHALLTVDAREVCVWCESAGYFFCNFIVMLHAFGTCLLIAAHDQTNSLVEFHSGITEKLHCVKSFQNRSLVICGSTSVNMVTFSGKFERIISPVTADRNDIKMSCNTDDFFAFAHLSIAAVIVQVYGLESEFIGNLECFLKYLCRAFAKRHSLCRSPKL